jgi:hypothetical protein
MLIDVILACAPAAVAFPAVFTLLTSNTSVASKARVEKRLYRTLLLAEKLPPGAAFAPQIAKDIDRQTLHVAYVAEYPLRAREIGHLVLIGVLALAILVGYYLLLAGDADLLTLLIALAVFAVAALWLERALLNFNGNDAIARELFAHFGAPDGLVRPRTELIAKAPALTVDATFERAADVRDANHGAAMTSLEAVNVVLAQAHSHFDWRSEALRLARRARDVDYRAEATRLARPVVEVDYRWHATAGARRTAVWAATAYDWLLRQVADPVFTWRLTFLDACERHRVAKAQKAGDVFEAAWLPAHYRNERHRVAEHWTQLHKGRDLSQKWGDGRPPSRQDVTA